MFRQTFANQLWKEPYLPILLFFSVCVFPRVKWRANISFRGEGRLIFFNLPNGLQKKEGTAHSLDFSMQYQLFLSILVEATFFKQISLRLGVGVGRGGGKVSVLLLIPCW